MASANSVKCTIYTPVFQPKMHVWSLKKYRKQVIMFMCTHIMGIHLPQRPSYIPVFLIFSPTQDLLKTWTFFYLCFNPLCLQLNTEHIVACRNRYSESSKERVYTNDVSQKKIDHQTRHCLHFSFFLKLQSAASFQLT